MAQPAPGDRPDLWWIDDLHASQCGSDLGALVNFGRMPGIDSGSFGVSERLAADLGISPGVAVRLPQVASEQPMLSGVALTRVPCLHAHPRAGSSGPSPQAFLACGRRGAGR